MAVSSYQAAVNQARRSGQAGRIVPSGPAGNITYRFVSSGGGGGGGRTVTAGGGGVGSTALSALKRAKAQYEPGGGFGRGVEAGLERGRVKTVSAGMQNLVSAGLAGTTMAGGLGLRYEEEVAAPTRTGLEEERARAISGIEMQEAGMGFQAGQAGLQRGFQAGESAASRSLQTYIANLQAKLQRESMAFRPRSIAQPVQQAQQFPSLYGQETSVPNWMGDNGTADTPWPTPAPLFKEQEELGLFVGNY